MQSSGYGLKPQVLLARSKEDREDVEKGFCYPFDGYFAGHFCRFPEIGVDNMDYQDWLAFVVMSV